MKDFLGNELKVGDKVVFSHQSYRKLCRANISGFTKLYVNLEVINDSDIYYRSSKVRQLPQQLMKVTK